MGLAVLKIDAQPDPLPQPIQPAIEATINNKQLPAPPQRNISIGDDGNDVKDIQQKFKDIGLDIVADRKFGEETANVVKNFQKKYGLTVDGIVGTETRQKLNEVLKLSKGHLT